MKQLYSTVHIKTDKFELFVPYEMAAILKV